MALFDLSIAELHEFRPEVAEPNDFETFWRTTLEQARSHDLRLRQEPIDNRQVTFTTTDVTFAGYGGQDVRAWLHLPAHSSGPHPAVVHFHGYSGGRGMPVGSLWAGAGYAHLVLDTRGQSWGTTTSFPTTPDEDPAAGTFHVPGTMTSGITSPQTYFYRRLFIDVLRLLEVAGQIEAIDSSAVVVHGVSQGGGMALAAAGLASLAGIEVAAAMPDVPFLCHFHRATELVDTAPYREISAYLARRPYEYDEVYRVLSYFDGVNFAKRSQVPALFSTALMDQVCPPSTVFAAYHAWSGDKEIRVYPHNGHEGGGEVHTWEQLAWLREVLGRAAPSR